MMKIYYHEGDVVQVRQDIFHKPAMIVKKVKKDHPYIGRALDKKDIKKVSTSKSVLKGIECYWFTATGEYQTAVFDTKDLEWVKGKNPHIVNGERINNHR